MSAPVYRPSGQWTDVCIDPSGAFLWVYAEGIGVTVERDGKVVQHTDCGMPLLFLRAALDLQGRVQAIAKGNAPGGPAIFVTGDGAVQNLGPTAGNNPVGLTATHAYVVTAPDWVQMIALADGTTTAIPVPWSSQGIRDVLPDGTIILGDATYAGQVGGHNFGEWQTRGDLTVGQHGYGIGVLLGTVFGMARQGLQQYGIHAAYRASDGIIGVCAWTEQGAFLRQMALDELFVLDPPTDPPPVKGPMPPTFDQWIKHEYPQVVAAYQYGHPLPDGRPGTDRPGDEWAAFQTLRRYSGFIAGMGESWTLQQMIAHERRQRPAGAPVDPSEPP